MAYDDHGDYGKTSTEQLLSLRQIEVFRTVMDASQFEISVLWNRRRPHSANLQKLIEILSRTLANLPALA